MNKTQKIHKVVKQWLEHAEEDLRLAKHTFSIICATNVFLINHSLFEALSINQLDKV